MSNWGNIILGFLQGKPAMILLVCVAVIAFVPFDSLEQVKQKYGIWITLAGVFSASSVFVNVLFWGKDWLYKVRREQKKEDVMTNTVWRRFTRLHPTMQKIIIDLFFSGQISMVARLNDPMVATLRDQGFLTVSNNGMLTTDDSGEFVITVMISTWMLDFMEEHKEEFQKQASKIANP